MSLNFPEFNLIMPKSLDEALEVLSERGGEIVIKAGGTKILLLVRLNMARLGTLMSIKKIGLEGVREEGEWIIIEANTTVGEALESPVVARGAPLLQEALRSLGDPQIRNMATVVGDIVNATPYATLVPPFLLLEGRVLLKSKNGERELGGLDFFKGLMETSQRPDELAIGVKFKKINGSFEFIEFKNDSVLPIVSVAVAKYDDGRIRVAMAGLEERPTLLDLTDLYRDSKSKEVFLKRTYKTIREEYAGKALGDIRASSEYRAHVAAVLTIRGLTEVI